MDTTAESSDQARGTRDRLVGRLRDIEADAEAMLRMAQRSGSEQFDATRDKFTSSLHQARRELAALEDAAAYKVRRAARTADRAAHEHPYATAGLAAGVGLLVGMLLSRR